MNRGVETILYPVKDINRAKKMFSRLLNVEPEVDQPYYVGYQLGNQQIGLVPNGHSQGNEGPTVYYTVSDIQQSKQLLLEAGGKIIQDIRDMGGGKLVATVCEPEGNIIGLIQMP
jgi:predicted enzyme related to lactoylglutathione lyase